MKFEQVERRFNNMDDIRKSRLPLFSVLSTYLMPHNDPYYIDKDGQFTLQRYCQLIENTPLWALNVTAAGIFNAIMPSGKKWFRLESADNDLNNYTMTKYVEEYVYKKVETSKVNEILIDNIADMIVYGISVNQKRISKDGKTDIIKLAPGAAGVAVNSKNEVNGVSLECKTTLYEFERDFGFLPRESLGKSPFDEIEYKILATENALGDLDDKGLKQNWIEYYFYSGKKEVLKKIGYKRNPYLVCRMGKAQNGWGIGNGIKTIGAMASLNELMKDFFNALEEQFDPSTV